MDCGEPEVLTFSAPVLRWLRDGEHLGWRTTDKSFANYAARLPGYFQINLGIHLIGPRVNRWRLPFGWGCNLITNEVMLSSQLQVWSTQPFTFDKSSRSYKFRLNSGLGGWLPTGGVWQCRGTAQTVAAAEYGNNPLRVSGGSNPLYPITKISKNRLTFAGFWFARSSAKVQIRTSRS